MLSSLGLSPSAVLLSIALLAVSPLSATAADVASSPSSTASSPFTRTTPVFVFAESPHLLSNAAVTRLRYYYQDEATAELITITAESGISQAVPSVMQTVKVEDLNILPDGEAVMRRRDHAGMLRAGGMNCLDSTVTDVQISSLFFRKFSKSTLLFLCYSQVGILTCSFMCYPLTFHRWRTRSNHLPMSRFDHSPLQPRLHFLRESNSRNSWLSSRNYSGDPASNRKWAIRSYCRFCRWFGWTGSQEYPNRRKQGGLRIPEEWSSAHGNGWSQYWTDY